MAQAGWTAGPASTTAATTGWTPGPAPSRPASQTTLPDWIDRLTAWLPAIGGTTGGLMGGASIGPGGAIMGAALGGAAGEAYQELINRARGHQAPTTMTEAGEKMESQAGLQAGLQAGGQAIGEVTTPVVRALGARLMQSAVKPGIELLRQGGQNVSMPGVVQTLLDEGINVTSGGLKKLHTLLNATNSQIAEAIRPATGRVSMLDVAGRLNQTAQRFSAQVNPTADLQAISDVGEQFLAHPNVTGPTMSVPEAQAMKVGTYARIGEKYGQSSASSIEAEKALARGLKEAIAAEVPNVSALNAREGHLLDALDAAGKRVALSGNRNIIGFSWVTHNPVTFLASLFDRSPVIKSLVARGLYQYAGHAAQVDPQLIRAAVQSLVSENPSADQPANQTGVGVPDNQKVK